MKKLFTYALMSAAVLAGATSCSQEEDITLDAKGDGNVIFNVQLPTDLKTRALTTIYGSGLDATQLSYAVYQENANGYTQVGQTKNATFTNLQTTVSFKLVVGKTYTVVFWAQDPTATAFDIDWAGRSFKVDYTKLAANDEASDAFYTVKKFKVEGVINETAVLKRPFAQLNIGSNDLDEESVDVAFGENNLKAAVSVSGVYTDFDFISGEPTGNTTSATFPMTAMPQGQTFPVPAYEYLSMHYLLVPSTQSRLTDCRFTINAGDEQLNEISIPNVPVQGNYRTNIYGQLLTSDANYNVIIEPAFLGDHTLLGDWEENGGELTLAMDMTVDKPIVVAEGKTLTLNLNGHSLIYSGTDAKGFLFHVNGGTLAINGEGYLYGGKGATDANACIRADKGTVTLNGGNYFVGNDAAGIGNPCIETLDATITINGGHYECEGQAYGKYFVLNKVNNGSGTISVKGGEFVNYNPADGDDATEGDTFVAEGYESILMEGSNPKTWEVVAKK